MALEAQKLADQIEASEPADRRVRQERRGKDRRKPGSRINSDAPRRSLLQLFAAYAIALMGAVIAITALATVILELDVPATAFLIEGGLFGVAILLIALGAIEQRLIEIRLELMMLNGGRRQTEDRRQANRRGLSGG